MVGDKLNFNWQEVFNKFSDDLANAFDLFTGNLKLTKVFKATIIEKINDTVYKISYKNAEYKVKSYYDLIIGDIVWVCAPGGDWDSLFVQSYNGFLDRIVTTDKVVNNLTTNVAGTVLDGRMGKSLKDQIDALNSNLTAVSGTVNYFSQKEVAIGNNRNIVVYCTRRGHTVDVVFVANSRISFSGSPFKFFTLSEEFRPSIMKYIIGYDPKMLIQINPNGDVITYQSATDALIYGQCAYNVQ